MTDIYQLHADGIRQVQDYLGTACPVFTWSGADWLAMPDSVMRRKDLGPGGFALDADLTMTVLLAQFGSSQPALKQTLFYMGMVYRIDAITHSPGGYQAELKCNDAAAGA